jgi:hypothetical protein
MKPKFGTLFFSVLSAPLSSTFLNRDDVLITGPINVPLFEGSTVMEEKHVQLNKHRHD